MEDDERNDPFETGGEERQPGSPLAMVGVGVGAASLPSLGELVASLTPDADAAYLIAVRQKEGLDVATVMDALGRSSALPVTLAAHGARSAPGRV